MRINKYIAFHMGLSRREVDELIEQGSVRVNNQVATLGQRVGDNDEITVDGKPLGAGELQYFLLNKPVGYVCSRKQQGSHPTIYELIPEEFSHLKPVGRLDYDSSGLLVLTNDGDFAHELTHPKFEKIKKYRVELDKPLADQDLWQLEKGVELDDGVSELHITGSGKKIEVSMHQGRNRQIRRTFATLGYEVKKLHRYMFGPYSINHDEPLAEGELRATSRR